MRIYTHQRVGITFSLAYSLTKLYYFLSFPRQCSPNAAQRLIRHHCCCCPLGIDLCSYRSISAAANFCTFFSLFLIYQYEITSRFQSPQLQLIFTIFGPDLLRLWVDSRGVLSLSSTLFLTIARPTPQVPMASCLPFFNQ